MANDNDEIEMKKRKESDDIIPHVKPGIVANTKFEDIKPKNDGGKFLFDTQNKNENKANEIDKITTNFQKCDSIITQYIKEFTEDKEKEKFFKKKRTHSHKKF